MKAILTMKNIKGHSKVVTLDKTNILTGPNGSGKSAILESLIVALDGVHPTADKTLAGICSMISGDSGEIGLRMEQDNGITINIRRVFANGEAKSQKIYINDAEVQQASARDKIDEFMGGGAMRRISPFRFAAMSPKDRLAAIADLLPAGSVNAGDILDRGLYSGSEEFMGQTRYALGKTVDELTGDEMREVAEKAKVVDKDYLNLIEPYLGAGPNVDAIDEAAGKIRSVIIETQAEITRYTKSIQTHQDSLGSEIWEKDDPAQQIAILDQEIVEREKSLAESRYASNQSETQKRELESIGANVDGQLLESSRKAVKQFKKYADMTGSASEARTEMDRISAEIRKHEQCLPMVETLTSNQQQFNEEIAATKKDKQRYADESAELNIQIAELKAEIETLDAYTKILKEGECPVCESAVDGKKINAARRASIKAKKDKLKQLGHVRDTAQKKWTEAGAELTAAWGRYNECVQTLAQVQAGVLNADDLQKHRSRLAELPALIEGLEKRDKYKSSLQYIKEYDEAIGRQRKVLDNMATSLKKVLVNEEKIQSEINDLQAKKESLQAKQKIQAEKEAIKNMLASEQIVLEQLKDERQILKKISAIIQDAKKKTYWFIQNIIDEVRNVMGYDAIIGAQMFGLEKDGIEISDKVLSGGEKLMYITSVLIAATEMSQGNSIIEIEGGELDRENCIKMAHRLEESRVNMSIITTHVPIDDVDGINVIRLGEI